MENNIAPMRPGQVIQSPAEALMQKAEQYVNEMRAKLDAKISREVISKRDAGNGRSLDYLEGWYVIARMNEIFGQGNWSYVTEEMRLVHAGEVNGKQVAHYVAKVAVRAMNTIFTDYGYGDGTDKYNPGKAHELAVKEAVTDGIKRACKNFGMSMGLALYDKTQENVDNGETEVKSAVGAGNSKRAEAVEPKGSKNTAVPANAEAPIVGGSQPSGGTGKTTLVSQAKTREELNALISAAAKTAVAKRKFADMGELRSHMMTNFGVDKKEALTDDQAKTFLNTLDTMINGG